MAHTKRLLLAAALLLLVVPGCNKESLAIQIPKLTITPMPTETQTLLAEPVGLNLGDIPFFGFSTATFELSNDAVGTLRIDSTTLKSSSGGEFAILEAPTELKSQETGNLVIQFSPQQDDSEAVAIIELQTNAGKDLNDVYEVQVTGTGLFIGEPRLVINYGGLDFPLSSHCQSDANDLTSCVLDTLDFGFIPLDQEATQPITLKNVPEAGTCRLPNLPSGEPDCTPACVITFEANPDAQNLGLGFVPTDAGFGLVGASPIPFKLAPKDDNCPAQDETLNLVRGQIPLLTHFAGAAEESDHTAKMLLESNAPNAEQVEIPMLAKARHAPVAIAKVRPCSVDNVTECSDAEDLNPLMRVYFDGTDSHDPSGGTIVSYLWEVIEVPPGTDTLMLQETGATTPYFSFWMPLTGTYTVQLTVTNDLGVPSAVTETSRIEVTSHPDSRLHIQLVWDSPTADLDLHFVYAGQEPSGREVYHKDWDCYWFRCRPSNVPEDHGANRWFTSSAAFEGPNPHLDIDDTNGFGPENTNIDIPAAGKYHIYVHYYAIGNGDDMERTGTTIRVYAEGLLIGEFQRALNKNDLWAVAEVEWFADGSSSIVPAEADTQGLSGAVTQLPYVPAGGEGFYFPNVFP